MELTVDNIRRTDQVATADKSAPALSSVDGERIRVLAIDDNEEFRNLIKELLEPHGFDDMRRRQSC